MNWLALSHKHPNTMVKFRNWAWQNNVGFEPHIRHLYDFFDAEEIIIEIGVDWTTEPKYCYRVVGDYWGDDRQRKWSDLFYKREEAEEAGFTKAFEILEQKLKEGK